MYKIRLLSNGKFLEEKEWQYLVECNEENATVFGEEEAKNIKTNLSQHGKFVCELVEV